MKFYGAFKETVAFRCANQNLWLVSEELHDKVTQSWPIDLKEHEGVISWLIKPSPRRSHKEMDIDFPL